MKFLKVWSCVLLVFGLAFMSGAIKADIGSGDCSGFCLEDYDSCGAPGNLEDLEYACDEVFGFWYECDDSTNWEGDRCTYAYWDMFHEDEMSYGGNYGMDWWTVDDAKFVYWVGHGTIVNGDTFRGAACGIYGYNRFYSSHMRLGEENGQYASPYYGKAKCRAPDIR